MMKKTIVLKKTASLVLALLMIVSTLIVLPFGASAETPNGWADSDTENNIYYIATPADMKSFQSTAAAQAADAKVYLTADIDMSQVNDWVPLTAFSGSFDGLGHTISNLTVNGQTALFISACGEIKNVTFDKFEVTSSTKFENSFVVAASIANNTLTIDNVHIKNSTFSRSGGNADVRRVGAFVGSAKCPITINNCSLIDSTIAFNTQGGGFVGFTTAGAASEIKITNCYTNAAIQNGSTSWTGGILGYLQTGNVQIENVVFDGTLAATGGTVSYIGHIVGNNSLTVNNFIALGTACELITLDSANVTARNMTNCITAAGLAEETTVTALKEAGWVKTADKVTVGENEVAVFVPASVCTYFTCPIPTTDIYYQVQKTVTGQYNIRFVAVVNDLDYANVGFNVQATRGEGESAQTSQKITKTTTTVYKSVTALGEPVTAESLGGQYIYVIEIKNVDVANYAHSFNVSAFVTVQNGTDQIVWEAATQTATVAKAS